MIHKNCRVRMFSTMLLWIIMASSMEGMGRWHFHTVNVKDGLADNFVRDITVDSEGYVWLSTINGLSRYDGYRFLNFHPRQWGGRSGDVRVVRETADGTLWAVSSEELFIYDRSMQTWRKNGTAGLCYVDENGDLWMATERELHHWNYRDGRQERIDCRGLAPILHIVAKNGTTLVVTADYQIYKVTAHGTLTLLTRHPKTRPESRDSRAMIDSRMNLWLYHAHESVGDLWVWSLGTGQWRQPDELRRMGDDVTVNAMAEDREGRLWVGTGNRGICVVDQDHTILLPMSSHITCLYADRNNTMWVGMAKLGAAYADLNSPEFVHTLTDGHEDVSALMEDSSGNLWIGFDGDGVIKKGKAESEKPVHYSLTPSNNVTALAIDGHGGILAGTYGGGIARLEGNSFVRLYADYDRLQYVKAIAIDRHGSLWVATVDKGVVRITAEQRFTNYTTVNAPLRSDGIMCMAYDAAGDRIYIGTSIGLAAYDCSRERFVSDNSLDSLNSVNVTALLVDNGGRLWIGSRNGLWVKGKRLTHLTVEQGLTNNVVRAIAISGSTVWASTDNGLTSITADGDIYRCRPFFDDDGLHGIVFSNNAALTTRNGTVLLGSLTGYINIPPSNLLLGVAPFTGGQEQCAVKTDTGVPAPLCSVVPNWGRQEVTSLNVRFTEFRINGNPVIKSPQGFTIGYGERLGVSISMMVPALSHKARYLYRFKGEEEWMRAPGNMLYFASLMPGNHVLQVKAELPGMATSEVSELVFKVLPPFWLSKWAVFCYLLLLVAIVWLVWRAIRRRQKREVAMKQMEINLRKYEMEEDKIRFFTNISHDLKTPLTLVVAPLEKIRQYNLPEAIRTEIDVAWRNARQLYDLVLELLDFRRLDVGKEKLNLSHGDLVSFVRQTAQAFAYYTTRKQINLLLELPMSSIEMLFDENKMRRIITNLLSNAYKYNIDGGSVTVTLTDTPSTICLNVADTGIGVKDKYHIFDRFVQETHGQEQEGSGLGLHIVRQYVDMMGGSITVSDNQPQGTVFTVALPVLTEGSNSKDHLTIPEQSSPTRNLSQFSSISSHLSTILVVEDNTDARLFLQRSLEDEYHVLLASNGKEALNQLAKADSVSIIVSDVMMPVMDGMELVRQIRKNIRYSHIPVILLTAKSSEEDIIAGLEEGVADYLTKPYSLTVLRLRIRKILEWTQYVHEQVATGIEIKPSEITVSSLDEELINHVIAEVEANIGDPNYSVVQLSAAVGMTRGTLYKKLMAVVGKSPIEFIRIIRLKRGKNLLDQGRTNVSEVADKVGISPKMFAQYFREMYGNTPSDYLKRQKLNNKP